MAEEQLQQLNRPQDLFEAVKGFVADLERKAGRLYFAALVHFESQLSEWTILLGSRRLSQDNFKGIDLVAREMERRLPARYRQVIAKIGIVEPDDPFFRSIAALAQVPPPPRMARFESCVFNGLAVPNMCLFLASTEIADEESRPTRPSSIARGKKRVKQKR